MREGNREVSRVATKSVQESFQEMETFMASSGKSERGQMFRHVSVLQRLFAQIEAV